MRYQVVITFTFFYSEAETGNHIKLILVKVIFLIEIRPAASYLDLHDKYLAQKYQSDSFKTNTVRDYASLAFVKQYLLLSSIFSYQESACSVHNDPPAKGRDISLSLSLSGLYSGCQKYIETLSLFFQSNTLSCSFSHILSFAMLFSLLSLSLVRTFVPSQHVLSLFHRLSLLFLLLSITIAVFHAHNYIHALIWVLFSL